MNGVYLEMRREIKGKLVSGKFFSLFFLTFQTLLFWGAGGARGVLSMCCLCLQGQGAGCNSSFCGATQSLWFAGISPLLSPCLSQKFLLCFPQLKASYEWQYVPLDDLITAMKHPVTNSGVILG